VVVKPVPFTQRLVRADVDTSRARVDVDELPDVELDAQQPIVTMGSYTLARIAAARGYRPGAWLDGLDYTTWSKAWQPSQLLNPNARVCRFGDADFDDEVAFVRPVEDSKAFVDLDDLAARRCLRHVEHEGAVGHPFLDARLRKRHHLVVGPRCVHHVLAALVAAHGDDAAVDDPAARLGEDADGLCDQHLGVDGEGIAGLGAVEHTTLPAAPLTALKHLARSLNAAGFYAADVLKLVSAIETRFG
jgi:hypothetical protein